MKLGICEWSLPVTGPGSVRMASDLGFEGLALPVGVYETGYCLGNKYIQRCYLDEAKHYNIRFTSLSVADVWRFCMYGQEGSEERKVADQAVKIAIDAAADMEIPLVFIPCVGKSDISDEDTMQRAAARFQQICDYAKPKEVTVCCENVLDARNNRKLIELVSKDNFKIYFDTQNPNGYHGHDCAAIIRELGANLAETHVKDGTAGQIGTALIGEGTSDFASSMAALKEIGYDGYLVSENNYFQNPLREIAEDPFDLIRKDVETLKKYL